MATMKALTPSQIKSQKEVMDRGTVSVREISCGPHERNKLDLFLPTSSTGGKRPLVLFAFGGGFVNGDKRMPPAQGSMYFNVGSYFLEQAGLNAININYRLFPAHEAKYPSGGEDVALALKWLAETDDAEVKEKVDLNNIFLFGTSAGAFHLATYLWCPQDKKTWAPTPSNLKISGFLCWNIPAHFANSEASRAPILKGYLGEDLAANDAVTMRRGSKDKTPALVAWSDHDMPTEIVEPVSVAEAKAKRAHPNADEGCMAHNLSHLSVTDSRSTESLVFLA